MDTETRLREAMRAATAGRIDAVAFDPIGRRVRQRRRRTVVAACALAAVTVLTPVGVAQLGTVPDPVHPTRTVRPTPPAWKSANPAVLDPALVQRRWTKQRWQRLPWSTTGLPPVLDPGAADPTSLSADPVGRALAVVQDRGRGPIHLLGTDGRWREQDVVDVEPTEDADGGHSSPLGVVSLSADGTRLALPQPHGLYVIDLTTNTADLLDLPGLPQWAGWVPDGERVLVSFQPDGAYGEQSLLVDVETGSWRRVPYDARLTSYASDGTAVEAHTVGQSRFAYELRRFDADTEVASVPLEVNLFEDGEATLAAGRDVVAVMRDVQMATVPRMAGAWPGPAVVDIDTGKALAQLPIHGFPMLIGSHPLGWVDEDTVLLRLGDHVVAWDYQAGELRRVTRVANAGGGPDTMTVATTLVGADN